MAPTLTSNSFLLTTTPHSRISPRNHRLTVFAKKAGPFSPFGKTADDSSPDEGQSSGNSSPFRFDFSKLPDVKSLVPVVANPSSGLGIGAQRRKDPGTVFVAGATGQAGIRIAQTLLRQGFSVRAGVPDLGAAQELARLAAKYKIISNDESKRLNAVDSSFEDAESIAKAIGNASKVVVTIGPAENGPSAEVTTSDALQVIEAAQLANVGHVAIVYDGSSAISSTYKVLDDISSFFNNLFSRSQALTMAEFLQKVVETDVSYTLIKTSLTEDFSPESSYNLVVAPEGNAGVNDYKVAKSQIASLVADVFTNTAVAENKVVEVFTDPSAPSKAIDELFSAIPEDGRRKVYAETLAKAKAEEEAIKASEQAREAAEAAKKLEEEVKKLEEQEAQAASLAAEAQKKAEAAGASVESFLDKAKGASVGGFLDKAKGISLENLSSQLKSAVQKLDKEPKVQIATVRGQAKARSLPSLKAVVKNPARQPKDIPQPKAKQTESKKETRKVFGGLFQQETIYIDDD
ncbi:protein PLASTID TRANSCRIPTIONALLY ACTIVE 16, chloroplastic [Sesamum alatum]|uniref:Protein PLASTID TRANSCRIPTIONALLY ACTIVE 16, chloroplastic n=1 Tax=Sesamum alatum TaxID=300844 RepID=A0AAE2CF68_9LAMI|nr:protein PLASTID TRANSCRIPTIONALLY ACTIVE 16, chloroplastic [Sesamum alatum]